jgi:hypothetical protein
MRERKCASTLLPLLFQRARWPLWEHLEVNYSWIEEHFLVRNTIMHKGDLSCSHTVLLALWEQLSEKKHYKGDRCCGWVVFRGSQDHREGPSRLASLPMVGAAHCDSNTDEWVSSGSKVALQENWWVESVVLFLSKRLLFPGYLMFHFWQKNGLLFRILQPTQKE